jgi:cell division protein FtsQ
MGRKVVHILSVVLLGTLVGITMAFTSRVVKNVKCETIDVRYDGYQTLSLSREEIVNSVNDSILKKNIRDIDGEKIEKEIEKISAVKNAEVTKNVVAKEMGFEGILSVVVTFREPVLRIMSGDENYFLDKERVRIPVSTKYTANVPVATGKIDPEFAGNQLLDLVTFLEKDDFLKAQVKQIHVTDNGELILIPLVGNHQIEFGTPVRYQEKLRNLKAFYEQVIAQNNWNTYQKISVKYTNQIIGTKR